MVPIILVLSLDFRILGNRIIYMSKNPGPRLEGADLSVRTMNPGLHVEVPNSESKQLGVHGL